MSRRGKPQEQEITSAPRVPAPVPESVQTESREQREIRGKRTKKGKTRSGESA